MRRQDGLSLIAAVLTGMIAPPVLAQSEIQMQVQSSDNADGAGWTLPRDQMVGLPSASPTAKACTKKNCIFLVNLSNHRVTEFHYAVGADANGGPLWSKNQFASSFYFYSKRWTAWYPPADMGCKLALKVVMSIDGKDVEESGMFDVCANPRLLFYIRDPLKPGEVRGTVTLDPNPAAKPTTGPAPAKP